MDMKNKAEESKRRIRTILAQREGIPLEVRKMIDEIERTLIDKNEEMNINFTNISKYIEIQFDTFKRTHLKRIGQGRSDIKFGEIISDINKLQIALENGIKVNVLEKREDEDKKEAKRTTGKILGEVEYLLEDIYSQQRRILSTKEYSQDNIENIRYEIKSYMRRLIRSRYEARMEDEFSRDNMEVRSYLEEIISELQKETNNKELDNKEKFQEELKKDAPTLEEQSDDAQQRKLKNENKKENAEKILNEENSLPDDVLK